MRTDETNKRKIPLGKYESYYSDLLPSAGEGLFKDFHFSSLREMKQVPREKLAMNRKMVAVVGPEAGLINGGRFTTLDLNSGTLESVNFPNRTLVFDIKPDS